jgi:hypothetical protein
MRYGRDQAFLPVSPPSFLFTCQLIQELMSSMSLQSLTTFSQLNRRMILLLIASHLVWCCAVFGLWSFGSLIEGAGPWLAIGFISLQLYAAAQLLLPALLLHPEERSRGFYLLWGGILVLVVWLINQLNPSGDLQPALASIKSGLLLLIATVAGAAMARYIHRLWELVPVCIVMTLADFASWLYGPTGGFAIEIKEYYLSPEGPPPLVDMLLVKLAFPGACRDGTRFWCFRLDYGGVFRDRRSSL